MSGADETPKRPPASGFGHPDAFPAVPAYVISEACLHFMMTRTEHRKANALYHRLAERALKRTLFGRRELYEEYRGKAQYHLEGFLCRLHDIFRLYFEEAALEAYAARPSIFSDDVLRVQPGQPASLHFDAATRVIGRESAKPLEGFLDFLGALTVPTVTADEQRRSIRLIAALRNVIVHGDKFPDHRFDERTADLAFEYERLPSGRIKLDETWLLSQAPILERLVFAYDDRLVREFDIEGHFRYGLFWLDER